MTPNEGQTAAREPAAPAYASAPVSEPAPPTATPAASDKAAVPPPPDGQRCWEGFKEYVAGKNGNGFVTGLAQARGEFRDGVLTLTCHNGTHCSMMDKGDNYLRLLRLASEYFGDGVSLAFICLDREPVKSDGLVSREMQDHPVVQRVRETFECRDPALVYPRGR